MQEKKNTTSASPERSDIGKHICVSLPVCMGRGAEKVIKGGELAENYFDIHRLQDRHTRPLKMAHFEKQTGALVT